MSCLATAESLLLQGWRVSPDRLTNPIEHLFVFSPLLKELHCQLKARRPSLFLLNTPFLHFSHSTTRCKFIFSFTSIPSIDERAFSARPLSSVPSCALQARSPFSYHRIEPQPATIDPQRSHLTHHRSYHLITFTSA